MFTAVWYPNRYDKMAGLFTRKHAAAISRLNDICVVYTLPDENVKITSPLQLEVNNYEGVNEYSLYYHSSSIPVLKKIINFIFFSAAVIKLLRTVFRNEGRPDITHVNVLTRWGVVAYLVNKFYGIPYVVTEHWTRYLPQKNAFKGAVRKFLTKLVCRNAGKIMPVSGLLKDAMMNNCDLKGDYEIVENVVDDFFYTPAEPAKNDKKTILHVSCFYDDAKNISGIIEATEALKKKRNDFKVVMLGTGIDYEPLYNKAKDKGLLDVMDFIGEQTPEQVKEWMDKSDFFLLFSNYETAGVVLQEAIACGKPWVSSNVGVAQEDTENKNGITMNAGDVKALVDGMDWMLDHHMDYDLNDLRERAKMYSYDNISKKFNNIYNEVLNTK